MSRPLLPAVFVAAGAILFSAESMAATSLASFQVTAVVQNTCRIAVTPPVSAPPAVAKNLVSVDCQYGQAYSVRVEPVAVVVEAAPDKSAGTPMIVTVTY
jgi:hypothetical protein